MQGHQSILNDEGVLDQLEQVQESSKLAPILGSTNKLFNPEERPSF